MKSIPPALPPDPSAAQPTVPLRLLRALPSRETVRKGPLAALDQAVISLGNFLAALFLARFVSPTQLGVYTVGFLAVLGVRAAQEGLVVQPLNAVGTGLEGERYRRWLSATGLFQLLLAVGSAAAAWAVGQALTATGNDTAGPGVSALAFSFFAWQIQEFLRRVFYARGEVGRAVTNTILSNLIRLGLILAEGLAGRLTGVAGLNAMGWGGLAAAAWGLWQTRALWTGRGLAPLAVWRENWRAGRGVLGGTLANWVTVQLYPILTAGMISFAAAGAYQALQNLVAPVHVLLRASDTFLTPRIARRFQQGGFALLSEPLRKTYLLVGLPVLGLLGAAVLFVEPLLRLIRDETYLPFRAGILPMALFYGLWYAYWPLQSTLKAARASRPIFWANLLAMATMFTFGVWAIGRWGLYGALAGQALNALVINAVLWGSWRRLRRTAPDQGG